MRVLLQNMTREPEKGRVRMTVQFGDAPPEQFLGDFDAGDDNYKFCNVEEELFMRLSNLAAKKYCNCTIYQMELMGIISAFLSDQSIPPFPIEFGTTDFGFARPSNTKILLNRISRPFLMVWNWWKFRHIRRENLFKNGKDANPKPSPERWG